MDFSNLRVSELIKLGTVCEENLREISKMLGIRIFSIYGCVLPFGKYFFLKNIENGKNSICFPYHTHAYASMGIPRVTARISITKKFVLISFCCFFFLYLMVWNKTKSVETFWQDPRRSFFIFELRHHVYWNIIEFHS